MTKARKFRERLSKGVILADGAMGTMLYSRSISPLLCCDALNLTSPGLIKQIHVEYLEAGAEILETNTFGGNAVRLSASGLAGKVGAINEAAVRLAREAAGEAAFIAGAVGPLGASGFQARCIFREQVDALVQAGVDLLILETFYDLEELREAILAAREAAGGEMVIVAQVTVNDSGNLPSGIDTETFTGALDGSPADVIGCNCSNGPEVVLKTIQEMSRHSAKPLCAMPNAGPPGSLRSPEHMAQYALQFLSAGVKIVGGCCGTSPRYVKVIRSSIGL